VRQKPDETDGGVSGPDPALGDDAATLVPVQDALALDLPELLQRAQDYTRKSKSDRTWKAYRSDLEHFSAWCLARGLAPVPAEPATLRLYLTDHAGKLAVSTLSRRLSAITEAHQAHGVPSPAASPEVQFTWAGIRRTHGKPSKGKEAAVMDVVAAMVAPLEDRLIDHRDRALLLLGFAAALCACCWAPPCRLRRPLAAGGLRYDCGEARCPRARDHAPRPLEDPGSDARLHPRRTALLGQPSRQARAVTAQPATGS
jgi:hypothetical protein